MIERRPKRSEINPVNNNPIAKAIVDTESGKLLWVGLTAKYCDNKGIIGCIQYRDEKIAKPAKNKENSTALKAGEPYSIWLEDEFEDISTP